MPVDSDILFFDAECHVCSGLARQFAPIFRKRGFDLVPLQSDLAREHFRLEPAALLAEMRIATRHGTTLGGADALIYLSRFLWWGRPLYALALLPGARPLMRKCYGWFAAHRSCTGGQCPTVTRPGWHGWAPLPAFAALAAIATHGSPGWARMWALAGAVFAGCKWLTWWERPVRAGWKRSLAYLFLWPGMDVRSFLGRERRPSQPRRIEWLAASAKTGLGAALIWGTARQAARIDSLTAGWTGMVGLILFLHFGIFHLLALTWRSFRIDATPIMVIIGFGVLTLVDAAQMAAGERVARGLVAFIAVFWLARLAVQLFVFDCRAFLTNGLLKAGYHALTLAFVYLGAVYACAALGIHPEL